MLRFGLVLKHPSVKCPLMPSEQADLTVFCTPLLAGTSTSNSTTCKSMACRDLAIPAQWAASLLSTMTIGMLALSQGWQEASMRRFELLGALTACAMTPGERSGTCLVNNLQDSREWTNTRLWTRRHLTSPSRMTVSSLIFTPMAFLNACELKRVNAVLQGSTNA